MGTPKTQVILFMLYALIRSEEHFCDANSENCIAHEISDDIDEALNDLDQDDPDLVEAIRQYHVSPPSKFPYNLERKLNLQNLAGQFAQAKFVDELYNNSKLNGFFFEAGAYNGEVISNTLLFEVWRGWTGILVEANPDEYEKLLGKNRKCYSAGVCLSSKSRPEVVEFDAASIFGGVIQPGRLRPGDNIPENSRERFKAVQDERRVIRMQCFPLYSILLAVGETTVDYLSLDIEGAELSVLKSVPWEKVDVRVISLEICVKKLNDDANGDFESDYDETVDFLDSVGFEVYKRMWHTNEKRAVEVIFVQKGFEFPGGKVDPDNIDAVPANAP